MTPALQRPREAGQPAVDQHQARHFLFFFLNTFVSARDYLAHGGEIVHAYHCSDDEFR